MSNAAAPLATVVVATYNWSSVLPYAIGSVLRQDFADFELLVVGDGCTDDSEAVVAAIDDPRVRWINLPRNTGHQSAPNNEGLRQARGQLVAYLGHDDLWLPHHLSSLVRKIADGNDLVYATTAMVGADGTLSATPVSGHYARGSWVPPSSVVHRKAIVERIGAWRDYRELDEDPEVDLWKRAFDEGFSLAFVPRLSVIKFPAAFRRDCYRTRSCAEQAAWTTRIEAEPDLETTLLTQIALEASARRRACEGSLRLLGKQVLRRALSRLRASLRSSRRGATIDRRRKFKGLPG
ncbi:MAG: glycosyltransferase family 2 protein [Proteobacteria bacterium]|nr:glycosyltransferase family 2 protein [Pseudomonadota bacterium]